MMNDEIIYFQILINLIRETTGRLVKAEEECSRLQQELSTARRRGVSLDADFHGRERMLNQLQTKLAVLEQVLQTLYPSVSRFFNFVQFIGTQR